MMKSDVSIKRPVSAFGVVGKGMLVGVLYSVSALIHASPVSGESVYLDDNCGSNGASARHGGSRSGCTMQLDYHFTEPSMFGGRIQIRPLPPAGGAGGGSGAAQAVPAPAATIIGSAAANIPVVSAPEVVVTRALATRQIVAEAPPVVAPIVSGQPIDSISTPASTLPAPSLTAIAVPEPSTAGLLLGGFLALVGIRRIRATSSK